MKKIIKLFILMIVLFVATNAYAASVNISATKTNVYVGDSVSVNLSIFAGTWNLKVSGSGLSDSIVGYDLDGNKSTSKSYKIDTSTPGTKTITLTGDITDYETDVTTRNISKTISINVSQAPVTQPTTTTTTTRVVQPTKKTTVKDKTTTPVETTTAEVTTTVPAPTSINITEFKIVGYKLNFSKDTYEYTINVDDSVEELYVIVIGKDINAENAGIVNIKDKDSFDIIVRQGNQEVTYKINIDRGVVKGAFETNNKKSLDKYISTIFIISIGIIIFIVLLLYYLLSVKKGI